MSGQGRITSSRDCRNLGEKRACQDGGSEAEDTILIIKEGLLGLIEEISFLDSTCLSFNYGKDTSIDLLDLKDSGSQGC